MAPTAIELARAIDQKINSAKVSLNDVKHSVNASVVVERAKWAVDDIASAYHMAIRMLVQAERELDEMNGKIND